MESLICNVSDSCTLWTCFEGDSNPNRRIFRSTRNYAPMQTGYQGEASPFPLIDALIIEACTQVQILLLQSPVTLLSLSMVHSYDWGLKRQHLCML